MNDLMRDSIVSDLMRDAVVHDLMSDLRRTDKIDIEGDFQAPSGLDLMYAKIKTSNISKG